MPTEFNAESCPSRWNEDASQLHWKENSYVQFHSMLKKMLWGESPPHINDMETRAKHGRPSTARSSQLMLKGWQFIKVEKTRETFHGICAL